jgi:hypothetical protein
VARAGRKDPLRGAWQDKPAAINLIQKATLAVVEMMEVVEVFPILFKK